VYNFIDAKNPNIVEMGNQCIQTPSMICQNILYKIKEKHYESLKTGFKSLDSVFLSLCKHSITILVAQCGSGKSTLLMNVTRNLLEQGKKVLYIDLDGEADGNIFRLIQMITKTEILKHLMRPESQECTDYAYNIIENFMNNSQYENLHYWATSTATIEELETICDNPIYDLIIIDYIQALSASTEKEGTERVTEIAEKLKGMSMRVKAPLLVASQTARSTASDKKNTASVATPKGSSNIEERALTLINLTKDLDEKTGKDLGTRTLTIAKQRHWISGVSIQLRITPQFQLMEDM